MQNILINLCIASAITGFLLAACNTPTPENNETLPKVSIVDSANDAYLDCYINQFKWEKSDILSATFFVKNSNLCLNLDFKYNSVTFKNISLRLLLGKVKKVTNKQLVQFVNDTLLASIIYSYAEIDYHSESLFPVNHMAFELKPTALLCISKLDTVKNTIDGTFKAVAVDEKQKKYVFRNGIFKNIKFKFLKTK